MSATDERPQRAAIRQALGLPDTTEVMRSASGGWLVRVTDEQAALALDLAQRIGESATADTFIVNEQGATTAKPGTTAVVCSRDGGCKTLVASDTGNAADRERYVTERARGLARVFMQVGATREVSEDGVAAIFRDLIDRGVLK